MSWSVEEEKLPLPQRLWSALRDEVAEFRPGLFGVSVISSAIPAQAGGRLRAELLRGLGFDIGPGTLLLGTPRIRCLRVSMANKLAIGRDCLIDADVTFDLGERIALGDGVSLGRRVMILTASHELGPREHRAGRHIYAPVTIEKGASIGARAVVLPGVTIGEGAVVAEGSLINKDVPAHSRAAGVPARITEKLGA